MLKSVRLLPVPQERKEGPLPLKYGLIYRLKRLSPTRQNRCLTGLVDFATLVPDEGNDRIGSQRHRANGTTTRPLDSPKSIPRKRGAGDKEPKVRADKARYRKSKDLKWR